MKRLIAIALCLIAAPCWAGGAFGPFGIGMGSKGSGLAVCPDASHASLLCEDFDGSSDCGNDANGDTNCRNSWTVAGEGNGNSVDFTTTHSGSLTSAYKGAYAATFTDGDATATGPRAYKQLGTNVTTNYVQIYFNVTSGTGTNGRVVVVASANNSTTFSSNVSWQIGFYRVASTGCGSNPAYKMELMHSDGTTRYDYSDVTDLCLNTWYGVRVYYTYNNAAGIGWAIDYNLDGTFTDQVVAYPATTTRYSSYVWLSAFQSVTTEIPAVQFDMIKIDSTDYPGATAP